MSASKLKVGGAEARIPKPLRIRVPGAPNFRRHVDELLEVASVRDTPDSRATLDSNLQLAWGESSTLRKGRAPPEIFKQLKAHIEKTQVLLRKLGRFPATRDIGCDFCPVGDGTVSTLTVQEMKFGETLELPR